MPNPPHESAPDGDTEEDALEVGRYGEPPALTDPKEHTEVGRFEMERAAKVSGSRFGYMVGDTALVALALYRLALEHVGAAGFLPVIPPVLVREEAMYGTGFFPTERSNIYGIESDGLYLTGTSEVALAGLHMDEIVEELPLRYAGFSTNFRREAGAAGKDTRGMIRVHQFNKVEMYAYVRPEESWAEHERILEVEESILRELGLPYRVVNVAAGDLGAPAAKKYDCEAWFPTQGRYREVTSASNTTDYQARRLKVRFRGDRGTELVHTLNGTAVTDRALLAILENFQGDVPEVLHGFRAPTPASSALSRRGAASVAALAAASTGAPSMPRARWNGQPCGAIGTHSAHPRRPQRPWPGTVPTCKEYAGQAVRGHERAILGDRDVRDRQREAHAGLLAGALFQPARLVSFGPRHDEDLVDAGNLRRASSMASSGSGVTDLRRHALGRRRPPRSGGDRRGLGSGVVLGVRQPVEPESAPPRARRPATRRPRQARRRTSSRTSLSATSVVTTIEQALRHARWVPAVTRFKLRARSAAAEQRRQAWPRRSSRAPRSDAARAAGTRPARSRAASSRPGRSRPGGRGRRRSRSRRRPGTRTTARDGRAAVRAPRASRAARPVPALPTASSGSGWLTRVASRISMPALLQALELAPGQEARVRAGDPVGDHVLGGRQAQAHEDGRTP